MPGTVDSRWLVGQNTCHSAFKDFLSKEKARNLFGSRPCLISSTRKAIGSPKITALFFTYRWGEIVSPPSSMRISAWLWLLFLLFHHRLSD